MAHSAWLSGPSTAAPRRGLGCGVALALALGALGCERPPGTDGLKEWAPADHDRAEEQSSQANRPTAPTKAAGERGDAGGGSNQTLIEATWEQACSPCHGPVGHGDGPNGPMVNAPDITRADLLAQITDEGIAAQIKNGKNRMPKFDLPEPVVRGLVARIRANRGR
jgi:mono/diheme cytochrome c family protein